MGISITTAQTNLESALEQNWEIQKDLTKALKNLSKSPDLALMQVLMILGSESGGTMGLAQNGVSQDAQQMNIMTSLSNYTKSITEDVNTISSSSSTAAQKTAAATDLIKQCDGLKKALGTTTLTDPKTGKEWIDPATGKPVEWISQSMATKGLSGLSSFMAQVGTSDGASSVVGNITSWIKNPTSGAPTGQEQTQAMNKDLSIMGNLFQSLSTAAQNVVKEGNTTLTQYQSNESTLFTDFIALNKAIVAHSGNG